jgi:hypothetical protein
MQMGDYFVCYLLSMIYWDNWLYGQPTSDVQADSFIDISTRKSFALPASDLFGVDRLIIGLHPDNELNMGSKRSKAARLILQEKYRQRQSPIAPTRGNANYEEIIFGKWRLHLPIRD